MKSAPSRKCIEDAMEVDFPYAIFATVARKDHAPVQGRRR